MDDDINIRPAQQISTNFPTLIKLIIPHTPAGARMPFCPIRPKGIWPHTDMEIAEWVRELIQFGKYSGYLYMPEALRYFAVHCFWPPIGKNMARCPHHDRIRLLVFRLAQKEYEYGIATRNKFVDDAPEGI
jgi:hypothetical protein